MTWDLTRRRLARSINNKFIFEQIPLLHAIIFLIEMGLTARLAAKFNGFYDQRPVLTMMITNSILFSVADTVAQSITAIRQRRLRREQDTQDSTSSSRRSTPSALELDQKDPFTHRELIPESLGLPPPFDFERLTRFAGYGFLIAPIQFKWFQILSRTFPMTKGSKIVPALQRMALDQLVMAPAGIALFFSFMTITEGGGRQEVMHKLRDMYVPTLKANYLVWPAVQLINFRLMPVPLQLPFVSTVSIAWTAYLSLSNAAEDVTEIHPPSGSNIRLE